MEEFEFLDALDVVVQHMEERGAEALHAQRLLFLLQLPAFQLLDVLRKHRDNLIRAEQAADAEELRRKKVIGSRRLNEILARPMPREWTTMLTESFTDYERKFLPKRLWRFHGLTYHEAFGSLKEIKVYVQYDEVAANIKLSIYQATKIMDAYLHGPVAKEMDA